MTYIEHRNEATCKFKLPDTAASGVRYNIVPRYYSHVFYATRLYQIWLTRYAFNVSIARFTLCAQQLDTCQLYVLFYFGMLVGDVRRSVLNLSFINHNNVSIDHGELLRLLLKTDAPDRVFWVVKIRWYQSLSGTQRRNAGQQVGSISRPIPACRSLAIWRSQS